MKRLVLFAFLGALAFAAKAQGAHDFRISEVYIACEGDTTSSYLNEYGEACSWIEITNISYSTRDLRSCFLTNNRAVLNPLLTPAERMALMSPIRKGDPRTSVGARQCITFFADGLDNRGTLHLNFTLTRAVDDFIALYDANGITLLDSVTLPSSVPFGGSYAKEFSEDNPSGVWTTRTASQITANVINATGVSMEDKIAEWKRNDPHGVAMAILAMCIVFFCLILLFVFFNFFGWALAKASQIDRLRAIKALQQKTNKLVVMAKDGSSTKGVEMENYVAVIALAMHEYLGGTHDVESGVITIQHHKTAWETREYSIRQMPEQAVPEPGRIVVSHHGAENQ